MFRVNVLDPSVLYSYPAPDTLARVIEQMKVATVWIEGVDRALKHGDTFTLSGPLAVHVKNLYFNKYPSVLEIYEIPDVQF